MADDLDDGAFWLPPQFLADDDLMDLKNSVNNNDTISDKCFGRDNNDSGFYLPYQFPNGLGSFGPHSDLSSLETESDEEDYVVGLTRKMAQSTLNDDLWKADFCFPFENTEPWGAMARSPQSTLCTVLGGCGCKQGSSRGSPNCASKVSSPPAMDSNEAALDLLYAAAGKVARMRTLEEASAFYRSKGLQASSQKPVPISVPVKNPNSTPGFSSSQSQMSYQQMQAAQFQQLKRQQMMKLLSLGAWEQSKGSSGQYQQQQSYQAVQNRARNGGSGPLGLSLSAWPTLQQTQQQPGSGMRVVFLGNHVSKRECAGTGVFLPRRVGTPTETRKKPGCSTVLLPDRVVQALNLNIEAMDAQPQVQAPFNRSFTGDYDAAPKHRNNVTMAQQLHNRVRQQPVRGNEVRLPPEWTY